MWAIAEVTRGVQGADHIVGANRGWQVPADAGPDAHLNYTVWASKETFLLDDELTFNYQRNVHSVFEVNYSTFVNCSFSMWYGNDWIYNWTNRGGKTKLILNESRPYYFACGMGDHCRQGMKVAINVTHNTTKNSTSNLSSKPKDTSLASSHMPLLGTLIWSQLLLFLFVRLLYPSI
ncbi:hypothetical protein GOP47_0014554 [Adiantum capillus-veneris]|uniref:Phytocyanin domain-containing protein n=1 Tax=Adiantum capillus-veneris TaxID=13818 RepID=A0A9D4ZEY2_ADICA|nr:hypothetical protein GOP47_0014554 [Adiantum capillus-veneris]